MIRERLFDFVDRCAVGSEEFRLTPRSDTSPYARCFAIYVLHLLRHPSLFDRAEGLVKAVVRDIRQLRQAAGHDIRSKPYRQLLTFSLSALAILPGASPAMLNDLVAEQIESDIERQLAILGCLDGKAGSGNQAMFLAIFLIHARNFIGMNTQVRIDQWVDLHLRHMNCFGFWGNAEGMTHLQFQNGYHQYEILEYLNISNSNTSNMLRAVCSMADREGHFAPYPGGGGCYDYDAVFLLTPDGQIFDQSIRQLLLKTASTIKREQGVDGGFPESLSVRPRSAANGLKFIEHILSAIGNWSLLIERIRYGITLQRSKHDRIHTHWSRYSRAWDEADLWDSWFRMLALARIDVACNPHHYKEWGFIDYPGIGYHPSLRSFG